MLESATLFSPAGESPEADRREASVGPAAPEMGARHSPMPFGDYLLEQEIAHGGMGVVYRARQLSLGRTVAVKLLLLGRHASAESLLRFRREAQSAASLRHPHIVAIHEVGEHDGQPFFSMDYIEGHTLAALVKAGPLPPRQAAEHARTIADAVHYAHGQGVLHRDLKPSNILVDAFGGLRISDFGLAKRVDGSSDLTETGRLLGTPHYLAPEAAAGRVQEVGIPSDVYAIGAVFYEMLTGRPPFLAESIQETLLRIRDTDPLAPRTLNPAVPRDAETICLKALAKERSARYRTAQELSDDLRRFLQGQPIRARPVGRLEKLAKWTRRQPLVAGGLALAAGSLTGLLITLSISNLRVREAHERARVEAATKLEQLIEMQVQTANRLVDEKDTLAALVWLAEALRLERHELQAQVLRRRIGVLLRDVPALLAVGFHQGPIVNADFSADGGLALTVGEDRVVRLWRPGTESAEGPVLAPTGRVVWARFSPDGRRVATTTAEGGLQGWDVSTGAALGPARKLAPGVPALLDFHEAGPWCVAGLAGGLTLAASLDELDSGRVLRPVAELRQVRFTPDGSRLGWLTRDRIEFVQTTDWTPVEPALVVGEGVNHFRFAAGGGRLVTTGPGARVRVWDVATGEPLTPLLEVPSGLYTADLSPAGDRLVTGEWQARALLWDVGTARTVGAPLQHDGGVRLARFSRDDRWLVTSSWDRTVRLWDPQSGTPRAPILRHAGFALTGIFSPDGQRLLTASQDASVRIWQLPATTGASRSLNHGSGFEMVRLSADERLLLTPGFDGTTTVWDVGSEQAVHRLPCGSHVYDGTFTADAREVVTATQHGGAQVWELTDPPRQRFAVKHEGPVLRVGLSPDGKLLYSASEDRRTRVTRMVDGSELMALTLGSECREAEFSPEGKRIAVGTSEGVVQVWDLATGQAVSPEMTHGAGIWSLDFSRDGRRLLIGPGGEGMKACDAVIRDAATGERLVAFPHLDGVYDAVFSPDETIVATAGEENAAFLWDARTGERLTPPLRHRGYVRRVAFSPDGRLLATVSFDGTARVWEVATGEPVSPPLVHGDGAIQALWTRDGESLVTSSFDGVARIWDLSPNREPLPELRRRIELLSAHRLMGPAGLAPLTPAEMRDRWEVERRRGPHGSGEE